MFSNQAADRGAAGRPRVVVDWEVDAGPEPGVLRLLGIGHKTGRVGAYLHEHRVRYIAQALRKDVEPIPYMSEVLGVPAASLGVAASFEGTKRNPRRYLVFYAGANEWRTWFGGDWPEWTAGYATASDEGSAPGLVSVVSSGVVSVLVSVGFGSRNVADEDGSSLASESPPMPAALTPTRTARPPSRPMTTATPTRATSPVRTGRFSVSMSLGRGLPRG